MSRYRKSATSHRVRRAHAGYHAIQDKGRRQSPRTTVRHESVELPASKAQKLAATTHEAARNLSVVVWMINRHLDYVTRFNPQCKTGNDDLDNLIEKKLAWHGRPRNFDLARRHSRHDSLRLLECMTVVEGDAAWLFTDRGRVQGIEGSRIAQPTISDTTLPKATRELFSDRGLRVDASTGEVLQYLICKRSKEFGSGLAFDQIVDASWLAYRGHFRRFDQDRGISPLATAINSFQDLYESIEWTAVKVKLHALFGIALVRKVADTDTGLLTNQRLKQTTVVDPDSEESSTENKKAFEWDPDAINIIDDEDFDVKTIESATPSPNTVGFWDAVIRIGLACLDVPYSFFDSRGANFSVRVADRIQYEESAASKRERNAEVLSQYSDWIVPAWASGADPQITAAARAAGISPQQLADSIEWIAAGRPWLDKAAEVAGDTAAIAIAADNPEQVAKRRGGDVYENIRAIGRVMRAAEKEGVSLGFGLPGQAMIGDPTNPDNGRDPHNPHDPLPPPEDPAP